MNSSVNWLQRIAIIWVCIIMLVSCTADEESYFEELNLVVTIKGRELLELTLGTPESDVRDTIYFHDDHTGRNPIYFIPPDRLYFYDSEWTIEGAKLHNFRLGILSTPQILDLIGPEINDTTKMILLSSKDPAIHYQNHRRVIFREPYYLIDFPNTLWIYNQDGQSIHKEERRKSFIL